MNIFYAIQIYLSKYFSYLRNNSIKPTLKISKQKMNKNLTCLMFFCAAIGYNHAEAQKLEWDIQGKTYQVDTLFHAKVGPSTTETSLELSGAGKLRIFYTTTDITDPSVDLRVTKGANKLAGVATLSTMCKNATNSEARYFSGVNADFFGGTRPIGSNVVDSHVIYAINDGWSAFWTTDQGKIGLGNPWFKAIAKCGDKSANVTGINTDRGENALVIYNISRGTNTGTNVYGNEVKMSLIEGSITMRGKAKCKVESQPSSTGSMLLSDNTLVLSGNGTGSEFVAGLNVGDIIEFDFTTEFDQEGMIDQLVGGCPVILKDNETLNTQGAIDHLVANHPRTAIGYDASATKVVMLVVDGRQTTSAGCTSRALADIMRNVGCTDALNFDGGGSSELYSSNLGIRNSPSDGKERTVCNAIWAVAVSPQDSQVAEIRFEQHGVFVMPRFGYFKPRVYAYNKYGELIDTDFADYTLSCPEGLGSIVENGSTLFASGHGIHALTATYGSCTTTIPVEIGQAEPSFRLSQILIDNNRTYSVEVQALVNGQYMSIDNSALTWSSTDDNIVSVDNSGTIKGLKEGKATISGNVENIGGTIDVAVEIASSRYMPISNNFDDSWTISKSGISDFNISGNSPFAQLDFKVSNARSASVSLKKETTLYSLPDSVKIVVNPGDATIKSFTITMNGNGLRSKPITVEPVLTPNADNTILVAVSDFVDISDISVYPITFSSLKINFGGTVGVPYHVDIKTIEAVYSAIPSSGSGIVETTDDEENDLLLSHNPSSPGESISLNDDTEFRIYNATGQLVISGNGNTFNAPQTPGVYLVVTKHQSAKLLVR